MNVCVVSMCGASPMPGHSMCARHAYETAHGKPPSKEPRRIAPNRKAMKRQLEQILALTTT